MFKELILPVDVESEERGSILIVTKWKWAYEEFLNFQKKSQEFIQKNRNLKIYIFCNHPHCFTLGRGNERGNKKLVDFDGQLSSNLDFPLYPIHRGGGVTFHYPGQWIFYPIVNITQSYTLDDHMCWLLRSVKNCLVDEFSINGLITAKKLMGIWKEKKKIASIGVGVKRFVTEHGLALNLVFDEKMFKELKKINPCGMDSLTYKTVDEYVSGRNMIQSFHKRFITKEV